MEVLHVIPAIAPRYGGPSFAVRGLCGALSELPDLDLELVTTDADGASGIIVSHEIPDQFPVHVFARSFSERWKYSYGLSRWLQQNVRRFDVVHVHAVWSHSSTASVAAARRAGIPYVIRPAGMLSRYSLSQRAFAKHLYWSLVEKATVQAATCFHATSYPEREDIEKLRPDAPVEVIANSSGEARCDTGGDACGW